MNLNKSIKEKIKNYWWIIIVLLLIGGAFYWYEWRPNQTRKECIKIMTRASLNPSGLTGIFLKEYIGEEGYKRCLRERGLEK